MEEFLLYNNAYIKSKIKLSEYVQVAVSDGLPVIHIRLHTLFGIGTPSEFMFLGQILLALRSNQIFKMTSGSQLREYHHVSDDAKAIRLIADTSHYGITHVSHGNPISLSSIAVSIFDKLGKSNLLRLGAIPDPIVENYNLTLNSSSYIDVTLFRDSLPAIVKYIEMCYNVKKFRF
jgi:nucleoside-diphosphate-sugar epimerase